MQVIFNSIRLLHCTESLEIKDRGSTNVTGILVDAGKLSFIAEDLLLTILYRMQLEEVLT